MGHPGDAMVFAATWLSRMLARVPLPRPSPSHQTMVMPLPVPRLTIDMLDELPDDGTRYELLDGFLLVTPAPSNAHQVVATRLATMLSVALGGSGARVVAVGAIQRGNDTQLQPDVLVYPSVFSPAAQWREIRGWWLAVEVLSPSSRLYDREVKRGAYLALGVDEYWIVDPRDCSVEAWSRNRADSLRVTEKLVWRPAGIDRDVVIDLGALFDEVCDTGV